MDRYVLFALLSLLISGCAAGTFSEPKKDAAYYFQQGEEAFEDSRYEEAIEAWGKVRESFVSPELTTLAELKIADAHFANKEYIEAAVAYEEFLKQHPHYEKSSQVLYQLGTAYDRQILSPDRDQTATRNAISTMESLLRRYPEHAQAEEARAVIAKARENLAAHELYVGRFYLRTDRYQAALSRLVAIPRDYPGFSALDEVYYLMVRGYKETGEEQKAVDSLDRLVAGFPDSKFLDKARRALD